MKAGRSIREVCCWAVAAWVGTAAAQEPFLAQPEELSPPVVSTSQRYVFRGFSREDGLKLATWADKVAKRLEADVGLPLPFERSEMVRFSGAIRADSDEGLLLFGQGFIDGLLQQRITVENPGAVEEEQLLEGFVAVLLYRYALAEFKAAARGPDASVTIPDWFLIGMAQRLRPELRERNLRFIHDAWKRGEGLSAAQVLAIPSLPQDRVVEKAYCGMLVEWLQGNIAATLTWRGLFRELAAGRPLGLETCSRLVPGVQTSRDLSKAWDVWLAVQMEGLRDWGRLTFDDLIALKQILLRATAGYPPGHRGEPLKLEDLVVVRDAPWMPQLAADAAAELTSFSVGRTPALRAAAQGFIGYFQALGDPSAFGPTFQFTAGGPDVVLRRMLKEARDQVEDLEKEVVLRSHYMNQVQSSATTATNTPSPSAPAPAPPPEATAPAAPARPTLGDVRQRYLDQIEDQRSW